MRKWIAAVVLVVVAGAAAFLWLRGGAPEPRAAVFRGEPTSAHYDPIATRALDPEPLTVAEIFPSGSVTAGEVTLTVKGTETLTDCAQAVWGSAEEAVAGCTQVLRAHYATPDGRISGQFLIFNLADSVAADKLVTAFKSGGFVRLAPGTPAGFDGAHSWAQARALGHYVTLSWVGPAAAGERVDLTYSQVAVDSPSLAVQRRLLL
ncbi:hypothetical protein [Streptosporangium lutulentum]|uniref:Uncharacterized protein n=1 Tax=Streptosporangium lutulentum TaxID=1461250 RepID=A0ABT9QFG8_9ACTN|nr:hypothetical protein [Streptosporangium lutulentum]MDP9845043.1 hypothetical protein [Streptosporangium lutulentum]